jgi:flagellar basal-body rod modification protein FlgD
MSTSAISSASSASAAGSAGDAYANISTGDFLKMLLTELRNQDPLNPMDESEILQQVSQIKAIQSNQKLTDTLNALQLQQGIMAASIMLQKTVTGLTDDGVRITGDVDSVSVDGANVKVNVGGRVISLKNISQFGLNQNA